MKTSDKYSPDFESERLDVFQPDRDPLLPRGEIFSVPDGFFDGERKRLAELCRRESKSHRRTNLRRVVVRWSLAATAACLLVVAAVSISISMAKEQTVAPAAQTTAQATVAPASANDMAEASHSTEQTWTQSDEAESADVLLWLY